MSFIIFVMAASFSFRNAASAALGRRARSSAEAREAEPMANPAAVTTAAATSEVTNSFLVFKIRAFESSHLNLIVSPSKGGADVNDGSETLCDAASTAALIRSTHNGSGVWTFSHL